MNLDDAGDAGHTAAVIDVDPELIQRHLDKLLASESLAKAETPRKLLSYLTERALRGETPKETEIAFDVFGKDTSFNGAEHSIVRVSVRSLRQKLGEYYAGPGRHDDVRFDVPKGGYRLTVTLSEAAPSAAIPRGANDDDDGPASRLARPRSRMFAVSRGGRARTTCGVRALQRPSVEHVRTPSPSTPSSPEYATASSGRTSSRATDP